MNREDVAEGAAWIAANKGFVSAVAALLSVIVATAVIVHHASAVASSFDRRAVITEQRLDAVESMAALQGEQLRDMQRELRAISDEQLRRTAPVSEIRSMMDIMRRVEQRLGEAKP